MKVIVGLAARETVLMVCGFMGGQVTILQSGRTQGDPLNELSNTKYGINHVPDHDFHAAACTIVGTTDSSAK
jgi:hypothetical protein